MDLINSILQQDSVFGCLFIMLFLWEMVSNKKREEMLHAQINEGYTREVKYQEILKSQQEVITTELTEIKNYLQIKKYEKNVTVKEVLKNE